MTEQEYRAADGINKSTLWEMRKSPAHYKYLLEHPAEDTPALHFGRALHSAVLTPEAYLTDYVIAPSVDKRTKAGRELYAEWKASLPTGAEELSAEDAQTIGEMVEAIKGNKGVMSFLEGTRREVPIFWTDSKTGLPCKCRVDAWGDGTLLDLKTVTDAMSFERDACNYGYHVQAAHYIDAVWSQTHKVPEWYFIVIEKKPPYGIRFIRALPGFLDYGEFIRDELMEKVKECRDKGEWPSYKAGEISEPKWANWEVD